MFTLNVDRAYLFAHPERELNAEEQARYEAALRERARGVPTQYITGHQEFWGMDLIVTPAVLIPRPETEHVIETVLELAGVKQAGQEFPMRILDVGTGSGCIALALAKEFPAARKFMLPTYLPPRWKLRAPTRPGINWITASSFTSQTCWKVSTLPTWTSLFPTRPMSENQKKIKCNWMFASLSHAAPCLPDPRD